MIHWFRALARTGLPGRPFLPASRPGQRGRTVLRLEAVEDRTLASAVPVHPTKPVTTSTESHVAPVEGDTQSDDQGAATRDATTSSPSDGFHFGWDQPGPHAIDRGAIVSSADGSVVLNASFNGLTPTVLTGADSGRQELRLTESTSAEEPGTRPAQSRVASRSTDPGAPTDPGPADSVRTSQDGAPVGADHTSPAPAGSNSPVTPVPAANGATGTHTSVAANGPVRASQVNLDPGVPRSNGAVRSAHPIPGRTQTGPTLADLSDGALLHRFAADRDQTAFTALVQRHARLVLGVCQRVLGDFHAAQDASQATFLVLARKAGILDRNSPLGGWLYKVAYHLALRSRAVAARQRLGEQEAADEWADRGTTDNAADLDQRELHQVIREELEALPEKYRAPLTLCYLDGRSHADAAREIGLPRGSMAKRVGEGLEHLRERLLHRGLVL